MVNERASGAISWFQVIHAEPLPPLAKGIIEQIHTNFSRNFLDSPFILRIITCVG
jgi:hypothetical protein